MYARVSFLKGSPDRAAEADRMVREEVYPSVTKLPGNKGMLSLIDRSTGKMISITFWESEAAMRASAQDASKIRNQAATKTGVTEPPMVEMYEVMERGQQSSMSPVWYEGESASASY